MAITQWPWVCILEILQIHPWLARSTNTEFLGGPINSTFWDCAVSAKAWALIPFSVASVSHDWWWLSHKSRSDKTLWNTWSRSLNIKWNPSYPSKPPEASPWWQLTFSFWALPADKSPDMFGVKHLKPNTFSVIIHHPADINGVISEEKQVCKLALNDGIQEFYKSCMGEPNNAVIVSCVHPHSFWLP